MESKMSVSERLNEVVPQLKGAVQTVMDPMTPQEQRLGAYQACEQFKESSDLCAPCGILLAGKDNPSVVRHFGLQLLEHCIKFRWNDMSVQDKLYIKENAMKLMKEGTHEMLTEESHIKDALSRIVVEMMKREWPQQWPNLMAELDEMCKSGLTQTELVLVVLLRLAEDVAVFQCIPQKRRREMMTGLTSNLPALFAFFVSTLRENVINYDCAMPVGKVVAQNNCRIVQMVLRTLVGYVEWVATSVLIYDNGALLQQLCLLLTNEEFHLDAAECLLLITSRKGNVEDRKPLLVLFTEGAMSTILNAVMKASSSGVDEKNYLFLKRLCQVLTTLGSQLCVLWGSPANVERPSTFGEYLKAIQAFTEHPSQVIGSLTQSLWASFFRHQTISQDPVLISFIPAISQVCKTAFLKVGYPSQNNCPSCGYSRLDFESDEEFNSFYSKYRAEVSETVRCMTMLAPTVTFSVMAQCLDKRLTATAGGEMCVLTSPIFLDWEAMTIFMENVMARVFTATEPRPPAEEGTRLARAVLFYQTEDPLILSCILSCMSSLSPFITDNAELLQLMLSKIFSAAVFNLNGQTKATRSRAVKNVRRHACSVLVKTCKRYSKNLLGSFGVLYSHVQRLSNDPEELSRMEKVTLMEALVLISNEFKDFEKQAKFLGEIMTEVKTFWLSEEFDKVLHSVESFIGYIGINQPPVEPSSTDTCGINRSHLTYYISTIFSVMKRCQWPKEHQEAAQYGYICNGVFRNPAFSELGMLLQNVLHLLRALNALWLPQHLEQRHSAFALAYEPCEGDKLALLGLAQPPTSDNYDAPGNKDPLTRMRNFITTSHESCYHIMGNAGACLGMEFYALPNLAQFIQNTVFTNLHTVPNHRLRPILRVFLKPYIMACQANLQEAAVLPLLTIICPFMLDRLDSQWAAIGQREVNRVKENDDEDPASQEVLEDQLVRLLTRDYLELLGVVCLNRRYGPAGTSDGQEDDVVMDDGEGANNAQPQNPAQNKDNLLSELGQKVLASEAVAPSIIISVFNGLNWGDGPTCIRCAMVAVPILKYMIGAKRLSGSDVTSLYSSILTALQKHGEHEGSQAALISLALQAYELLRTDFQEEVGNVLCQIPNRNPNGWKQFDEKLNKPISDKRKRDFFKRLVEDIIGKSMSQRFKHINEIQDLPPLYKRARVKPVPVDVSETSDIGLCDLFKPEPNVSSETSGH